MNADDPVMRAFGGAFLNHPGLNPTARPTVDEPYTPDADVVQDRYVGDIYNQRREAEFARFISRVKAEAWAEGWEKGADYMCDDGDSYITSNPYREVAQ